MDALGNGISRGLLGGVELDSINQPKGINAARFEERRFKEGSGETSEEMFKHGQLDQFKMRLNITDLFVSDLFVSSREI